MNAAALALVENGRVHALSCQVGGPAWASAVPRLRILHEPHLGLHLDLTEHPLRMPARRLPAVIATSLRRGHDPRLLADEIRAQLDRFESMLGRAPDFVDGHQHVHQLPQVREALLQELQRRGPHRPWLRSTRRRPVPSAGLSGFKPWLIERLGAAGLLRQASHLGFASNRCLLGVYDFRADAGVYEAWLSRWLAAARDGDLLMCHPAGPMGGLADAISRARRVELEVLCSPAFEALRAAHGVTLAPLRPTLARGA